MNDIGGGLLLNVFFWIAVIIAMGIFGVWLGIRFWTTTRAKSDRKASPIPLPAPKKDEEQDREAA
jgi:hypothetical protein